MMFIFFFFNDTATTEIYTLSLHDALPISGRLAGLGVSARGSFGEVRRDVAWTFRSRPWSWYSRWPQRSEEHTSELQSRPHLVCRLLLEKKKKTRQCDASGTKLHSELRASS